MTGYKENLNFGLSENSIRIICAFFENIPQVKKVVVFGSRAMGTYKIYSDIDLAISGFFSEVMLSQLRGGLEELSLPYRFDVVAIDKVEFKPLLTHIQHHGRVIYQSSF